jgi:hypothetical protein
MQYAAKRDAHVGEVQDLKQQLELKGNEIRNLNSSIDSLKSVNEELKVQPIPLLCLLLANGIINLARICCHVCRHRGGQKPGGKRSGFGADTKGD